MDLITLLKLVDLVGPVVARLPTFIALYETLLVMIDPDDQSAAKQVLADIQADNDDGHRRLQEKLAAAR